MAASILKKIVLVLEGGSGATLGLRWYVDFSMNSSPTTIINLAPTSTGTTALWGASSSLYGTTSVTHTHVAATHPSNSTYSPVFGLEEYRTSLTGSAKKLKLNLSLLSNGFDASIQDLSIISLQGKIR